MKTCAEYNKLTYNYYSNIMRKQITAAQTASNVLEDHFTNCKSCEEDCPVLYLIRESPEWLDLNMIIINEVQAHFINCTDCRESVAQHIRTLKAPKTKKPKKELE